MGKLIIANWKMNPRTKREAVRLAQAEDFKNVVIVPPFPFLSAVKKSLKNSRLGAQDIFWENPPAGRGAYTGEVSSSQLKSLGVKYVIIGHSERRALGETDEIVNRKIKVALKEGLKVILCVGEPLAVRRKGLAAAERFVKRQLQKNLKGMSNVKRQMLNVIIAYEPVWAIGTGRSDKPEDTVMLIKFIRNFLDSKFKIPASPAGRQKSKILYGGSVNVKNADKFLTEKEIDGALVGGASLRTGEFNKIVRAALNHS